MSIWNWLRNVGFTQHAVRKHIPEELDLPHTFRCETCEVKWVENGLESQPCWNCSELVIPMCYHR